MVSLYVFVCWRVGMAQKVGLAVGGGVKLKMKINVMLIEIDISIVH